jgi:hypothetical protein
MKQFLGKPFLVFAMIATAIAVSISARQPMWPNMLALNNSLKQTCIQFQFLNGSNREIEYNKMKSLLFQNSNTAQVFNSKDLEKMLGSPNSVDTNGNWIYNLNPSNPNVKAVFEVRQ